MEVRCSTEVFRMERSNKPYIFKRTTNEIILCTLHAYLYVCFLYENMFRTSTLRLSVCDVSLKILILPSRPYTSYKPTLNCYILSFHLHQTLVSSSPECQPQTVGHVETADRPTWHHCRSSGLHSASTRLLPHLTTCTTCIRHPCT